MKMGHSHDDWGVESVDPSTSSSTSSFRRVVNKVNSNAKCRCCLWLLAVICASNIMFMLIGYDRMVNMVAVGQMVLQEGSGPKYEAWMQAPMPVYYKVTVFNLTNPVEFMNGARPRLKECGPYTYRMLEEKTDVEFFDNNTVTYRTKPMYIFEPSLSVGSEEDVIRTVNIPLVNAADAVKYNDFFKTVIQVAQKIHGFKTLRKLTVKELLWGYKSHVMDWARTLQELPYPHLQFGLLVGFNNTAQEPYTMYTGGSNPDFMNTIYAWNGKTKLDFWPGDECNAIRGTDASGFHPGVKTTDKLYIFNGQLCRSIPLEYQETVVHSGVETYRFVPPEDTFAYGEKYPQNECFCGKEGCPPRGLLDMKPCYWGAAIAFSFPHFYQGDPTLRHIVRGLKPDPELHGTEFDIYPKLGVPLRVKLRMQMNVVIDGNQALQRDRHFDIVFPVFWFEAGIDSLPLEMVGKLRMAQNLPSVVKTTSLSVCAALSVTFLVLLFASSMAAWCGITEKHSRTSTPEHLPNAPWPVKHTQRPATDRVFFNASGYAPGSMTSLTNGVESFPKPRLLYPTDEIDTLTNRTFDHPPSEDQPPAYSSKSDTQTSSASLVSVEIHKSASVQCIDDPPNSLLSPEDEFLQKRYSSVSDDSCFNDDEVERVTPSTPPVPLGSPVIAPLAKSENSNLDQTQHAVEPLATSSPHDSPNTSAMLGSDPKSALPHPELERSYDQRSALPPPLESHL